MTEISNPFNMLILEKVLFLSYIAKKKFSKICAYFENASLNVLLISESS